MAYYVRYENGEESLMKKCGTFISAQSHAKMFQKKGFKYIKICAAKDILKEGKFVI